jgi:hypothetical protein
LNGSIDLSRTPEQFRTFQEDYAVKTALLLYISKAVKERDSARLKELRLKNE